MKRFYKIGFGLGLGLDFGLWVIFELQLKEISNMKNKKIESGLAGLVFGHKEKQKKEKKMNENKEVGLAHVGLA